MRKRAHRRRLPQAVLAVIAATVCSCGPSPITAPRIEGAVGPTFANLVHLQLTRIGLPTIAASEISVLASCQKVMAGSNAIPAMRRPRASVHPESIHGAILRHACDSLIVPTRP